MKNAIKLASVVLTIYLLGYIFLQGAVNKILHKKYMHQPNKSWLSDLRCEKEILFCFLHNTNNVIVSSDLCNTLHNGLKFFLENNFYPVYYPKRSRRTGGNIEN